jgi:phosphatidylglycerophosphatase A
MPKDPTLKKQKKIAYPKHPWWWIATWFGCGMSPYVSGTVGSLGALPFAYLIHITFGGMGLAIASILIFLLGWWASNEFLKHTGRTDDASEVVVDEVAGQWLLLAALYPTWESYLVGFILFRLFDIVKPWPVNLADRKITGGLGIMFDDMLAGIYPVLVYLLIVLEAYITGSQNLLVPVINFLGGHYVQ